MHVTLTSPTVGLSAAYPCFTPTGPRDPRWRRHRQGVKSAPAHARYPKSHLDRRQLKTQPCNQKPPQTRSAAATRLSLDDVVNMAEYTREKTSLHSRRLVLEEAQRTLRSDGGFLDRSRPQSVLAPGLQAQTSPMPSPTRTGQVEHIPSLLPLPSDRTFIPSPDQNHDRHVTTTPTELYRLDDEGHHPVARQCCEIMGPSLCRSCRRLESRAQNRKQAEQECPRMRSAGGRGRQTFGLTQVVKRSYPRLSDAEIQDKLACGEIARLSFPWRAHAGRYYEDDDDYDRFGTGNSCSAASSARRSSVLEGGQDSSDNEEDEDDDDVQDVDPSTYRNCTPASQVHDEDYKNNGKADANITSNTNFYKTAASITSNNNNKNNSNHTAATTTTSNSASGSRYHVTKASLSVGNAFYFLARLKLRLQGETTTPLFFSDLRQMQDKILSGSVDRKAYMALRPDPARQRVMQQQQDLPFRLKSAVSTASTSSGKSGLSKLGSQLSREFMPAFVSPRKIKLIEEPKFKVYFEPPLLTKRRQIPNPSFFAGSSDEYSLPERLPDVIEFADSQRIAALEKQIRSGSALSLESSMSDEQITQQLQVSPSEQDKLTSLPLEKTGDEFGRRGRAGVDGRPASGKSGGGEGGVSAMTPRSLMRVSSGGPLSARAVPEENEEDLQRETDDVETRNKEHRRLRGEEEVKCMEEDSQEAGENKLGNNGIGVESAECGENAGNSCVIAQGDQSRKYQSDVNREEMDSVGKLPLPSGEERKEDDEPPKEALSFREEEGDGRALLSHSIFGAVGEQCQSEDLFSSEMVPEHTIGPDDRCSKVFLTENHGDLEKGQTRDTGLEGSAFTEGGATSVGESGGSGDNSIKYDNDGDDEEQGEEEDYIKDNDNGGDSDGDKCGGGDEGDGNRKSINDSNDNVESTSNENDN